MDKDIIILGKFYLKNGNIIEEKIVFDKDNDRNDIDSFINNTKDSIERAFRDSINFQFTFGFTVFRGSELAAITIEEIQ